MEKYEIERAGLVGSGVNINKYSPTSVPGPRGILKNKPAVFLSFFRPFADAPEIIRSRTNGRDRSEQ